MDRWADTDPEYDGADGVVDYVRRPAVKWIALLIAWVIVTGLLVHLHLTVLIWVVMVGLVGYVVYAIRRETPSAARPRQRRATNDVADERYDGYDAYAYDEPERFNAPPGWPEPPPGWTPPRGWQPNPAWPPAPPGWQFWLPPARQHLSERAWRTERARPTRSYRSDFDGNGHRSADNWP